MMIKFSNSRWCIAFLLLGVAIIVQLLLAEPWMWHSSIESAMGMPPTPSYIGNDII